MTRRIAATQVKARMLALLEEVAASGEVVEITKHGRTVARLVPATGSKALKGALAGVSMTAVDDEDTLFTTGSSWSIT